MKTFNLKTTYKKIIADTITPVSIYLKIRDKYPNSLLLESSDYRANDNNFSYICCNPIATIEVKNETITIINPDGEISQNKITPDTNVPEVINNFSKQFETEDNPFKFINNGIFGFTAYDAVRYFEDIEITKKEGDLDIPDLRYSVYQNIIAINHFNNEPLVMRS